jgi:hypothetical protein
MKKLMLVVAVVAVMLALPATASAHKLRAGFAVKQGRAIAQDYAFSHFFFTEADITSSPVNWTGKQYCNRLSKHVVVCVVGWIWDDAFSDDSVICTGNARSKLKRTSFKVKTVLRAVSCAPPPAPATANRSRLEARMSD